MLTAHIRLVPTPTPTGVDDKKVGTTEFRLFSNNGSSESSVSRSQTLLQHSKGGLGMRLTYTRHRRLCTIKTAATTWQYNHYIIW